MSGLWTPSGEHRPEHGSSTPEPPRPGGAAGSGPSGAPSEEERAAAEAELAQIQEQLLSTPVPEIIANHAIGLWQLAVLHLSQEERDLESAQLAIDALAALVDGLGDRLEPNAQALRDALAQARLAYVQVSSGEGDG